MIKVGKTHIVIPDVQVKPGVDTSHLADIGKYILDIKPDTVVVIGDFWDMESLSSYDKGKKCFEGRRYKADINAGKDAMTKLLKPLTDYNKKAVADHRARYKPALHFTIGNHEQRIMRACEDSPELDGVLSYADFDLKKFGFKTHDFLQIAVVDGINYVHYIQAANSPRALGNAKQIAQQMTRSTIVGHMQTLDMHYQPSRVVGDAPIIAMIVGACYTHREEYRGNQGQNHFRGIVRLSGVDGRGDFCPMFISLDYLKARYRGVKDEREVDNTNIKS